MSNAKWMPGVIPYGADQTAYLIIDRLTGNVQEIEVERADLEAVMDDFMSGHVNDPRRVIAFNTLEHWSEDISEQIAEEIQIRCDIEGDSIPEHIRDFVELHRQRAMATRSGMAGSPALYP